MIRFSAHAKERLADRKLTAREAFRIISTGTCRDIASTGNIDFFGRSDDGRPFQVTVDPSRFEDGVVVTIIDLEATRRAASK